MSRHPSPRTGAAASLAAVAVLCSGCGSSSSGATSTPNAGVGGLSAPSATAPTTLSGTVTVFAAASLTGSFTALGRAFEAAHPGTTVRFSFGASSALAQQILAGAPADLFASASPKNMKQVTAAGKASDPKPFASNSAEIAVAPGSAAKVTSIADLAKPGVKVALCQPEVPCGVLAKTVLGKAKVSVKPVTQGLDVKSTLAYVTNGQVDAAIVYVTDVKAAGAKVTGIEVPAADNASTDYPVAPVSGSAHAPLAQAFEDYVLSAAGKSVLAKAGFRTP